MNYAILEGKTVKPTGDFMKWGKWFQKADRTIAFDEIGHVAISTVFLGLNHGFGEDPLWFETMIFGGPHDRHIERYRTYDEALAGHKRAVKLALHEPRRGIFTEGE